MAQENILEVVAVSKSYDDLRHPVRALTEHLLGFSPLRAASTKVLDDVSFSMRGGETLGIIGSNGAGKSTLLQIICGTIEPTGGRVRLRGRVAALLELGAGFNPEFSGIENVRIAASLYGLSTRQINEALPKIAAFADIGEAIERPVKTYSSGMFMRLAFAVVAHVEAEILIIDEALAVGDILFVQKCMRFLREFRKRGALLLVSHDLSSVTGLCDRALWLDGGKARLLDDARTVVEAYVEAAYGERRGEAAVDATGAKRLRDQADTVDRTDLAGDAGSADFRHELLAASTLRNDIHVPAFDPDTPGFGSGLIRIRSVALVDHVKGPLSWITGGEELVLQVIFEALADLFSLIVGFVVRDKLGQILFGDNTYLTYMDRPVSLAAGETGKAHFAFRLPYLPAGDYVVTVGVASGTQEEHVQHQWLHEALVFRCETSHMHTGLVGIPMKSIALCRVDGGRQ